MVGAGGALADRDAEQKDEVRQGEEGESDPEIEEEMAVERNAYGRQNDSAILTSETSLTGGPLEMVFIRAPRITRTGPSVETLATRDGAPTLIRQGRLLAATFHPELTDDTRVHQLFLDIVRNIKA